MTISIEDMVRREVHYCASYLVSTLAVGAHGHITNNETYPRNPRLSDIAPLMELCDQAAELSCPIDDWEEAAVQAGWTFEPYPDDSPAKAIEPGYWSRPAVDIEANDEDDNGEPIKTADNAQAACESDDIEPYQREVYEHWIVSDWLADKLAEHGEKVDKDFAGLTVWARTTTGQGIAMDSVIQEIHADMLRA